MKSSVIHFGTAEGGVYMYVYSVVLQKTVKSGAGISSAADITPRLVLNEEKCRRRCFLSRRAAVDYLPLALWVGRRLPPLVLIANASCNYAGEGGFHSNGDLRWTTKSTNTPDEAEVIAKLLPNERKNAFYLPTFILF